MIPAAKAAYLSALLRTESKEFDSFNKPEEIADWIIEQPSETKLNKLKKSSPEAFYYWYKANEILRQNAV